MRDRTAKHLSTLHRLLYRATRGRVGRRLVNNDMLLLATTGRHTGKDHAVPLLYLTDDQDIVVIASWGGRDNHPEWYLNLQADPRASIQIEGHRRRVVVTTADTQRRARLWPTVLAAYAGYNQYQSKTDREIPVVVLSHDKE